MNYKTSYKSPIGMITIASDGENIIGLWFKDQKYYEDTLKGEIITDDELKVFNNCKKWLDEYFNNKKPEISKLPLKPHGTKFRQCVWNILTEIPYGETTTYGNIAKEVIKRLNKEKMSAQAIGGAVGHNHISIIIPCHRVIGSDGSLTGYAGGINKKIELLKHENINFSLPS